MGLKAKKSYKGKGKGFHGHPYEHSENMKEVWDQRLKAQYSKNLKQKEFLKGGYGDKIPSNQFDAIQVKKGIKVEMEHTNNPKIAEEIARDHLAEIPDYYDHLEKMEKTATSHKTNYVGDNPGKVHTKKFDRCVKEIEKKQKGKPKSKQVNPYAVCTESLGYEKSVTKKHRRKDSDGDGVPDYKDCKPYDPKKQDYGLSSEQQKSVENELGSQIAKNDYEESYMYGNVITLENDREYLIFDDEDEAESKCIRYVDNMLREEPELFDQDWLYDHIDTDKFGEDLARDMYDGEYENAEYEWNEEHPEKAKRIKELDKKRDEAFKKEGDAVKWYKTSEGKEYDKLTGERESYAEDLAEDYTNQIKDDPIQWWDDATGDPIPNLYYYLDDDTAEDAVRTDGVAHFFASYDGKEKTFKDGSVAYRIN